MDDEGPRIDALEQALADVTPAFFYTIPSYHNPTGVCSSAARRQTIVELAQRHDFRIIADEPYQLLYFYDAPPCAYGTMIDNESVVSLGSFSKILAPGMRLGWIQTSDALRKEILANGFINSGGSINHISSHIVRHAIDNDLLDAHLEKLRAIYRGRVEAMDEALHEHFDGLAEWTRPDGGYFMWMRFDESVDTAPLREKARVHETGFQAGPMFSGSEQLSNYLRLSFAHYNYKTQQWTHIPAYLDFGVFSVLGGNAKAFDFGLVRFSSGSVDLQFQANTFVPQTALFTTGAPNINQGGRAVVNGIRPIVNGGTYSVRVGVQDDIDDAVSFSAATSINSPRKGSRI